MMSSARVSLLAAAMAVGGVFASPAHALTPMAQPALLTDHGVAKPVEEVAYRRKYNRPYRYGYRRYPARRYYGGNYRPYRPYYRNYGYGYGYPGYGYGYGNGYGYPGYGYGYGYPYAYGAPGVSVGIGVPFVGFGWGGGWGHRGWGHRGWGGGGHWRRW
jgi:hypothetical protein